MATLDGSQANDQPGPVVAALAMAGRFGIERVAAIAQFESYGNENWLLETPDGRKVVLRRYPHSDRDRVQFQLDLLRHLSSNDFPVAHALSSTSRTQFEQDRDGVPWAAFGHIEGREYNFSTEDAVQAARRLADFHLLGADFAAQAPPLLHRPSLRECWANADADVAGLRDLFAGAGLDAELAYLASWWDDVRRDWPLQRVDGLPRGLVHGDFHGRNTAYVDGRLVGIFDFDDAEAGPLVHDLANSLYKFARTSRFDSTVRPDVLHAFLDAYESARPLTADERAALPVMMAVTYPPNPRYYRYYRDHHGTNLINRLRREVGLMQHLRREVERLF